MYNKCALYIMRVLSFIREQEQRVVYKCTLNVYHTSYLFILLDCQCIMGLAIFITCHSKQEQMLYIKV